MAERALAEAGHSPAAWKRYRIRGLIALSALAVAMLVLVVVHFARFGMEAGLLHARVMGEVAELHAAVTQLRRSGDRYLREAPRTYPDYQRDRRVYYGLLQDDLAQIDQRIEQLFAASLGTTGDDQAVRDAFAALQDFWGRYRVGLAERIGDDAEQPRLEWAAEHIVAQGADLERRIEDTIAILASAILAREQWVTTGATWGIALILALLTLGFVLPGRLLAKRINSTLRACQRIAEGDFGFRAPAVDDEFAPLQNALAQVSARLAISIGMLDSVHRGQDMAEILRHLQQSLSSMWPVDWMALYRNESSATHAILAQQSPLLDGCPASLAIAALQSHSPDLAAPDSALTAQLKLRDFQSAAVLTIAVDHGASFSLVMASKAGAPLSVADARLLRKLAPLIANGLQKTVLAEHLLLAAVEGLAKLAEQRDPETGDHLLRMSRYSAAIAQQLRAQKHPEALAKGPGWVSDILHFAPMHDIGKVGVADSILLKEGALDDSEREQMRRHPLIGGKVLRTCAQQLPPGSRHLFDTAIEIAEGHHERYDGDGYPHRRSGSDIPLSARIVALADVFDALTSRRPYKQAWSLARALDYVGAQSGAHFDPDVVAALQRAMPEIGAIYEAHKHV
jgi:HD-GYP domain-containing protein (c-di-GMP phosphodiesterase class II)